MSFLAPLYLALAAAVAVPLLIHLLRRRIGTRVEFPAARYLARAEQEHSRSLRIRNLLLMLLRVAIVLAVAIAAARPVARWTGAGHGPTALAIVIDNSLSTTAVVNGRPLIEQLRATAREALAQATTSDRLWLVTADGQVRGGSPAVLREELDRMTAVAGGGDLALAVERAAGAVRSSGLDSKQVAILTDAQRTSWSKDVDVPDVQVLVWMPGGAPPVNRAVVFTEARPERWTPRGAIVARFLSRDSTTYRITLSSADGGTRSLARGTAAAGEEVVVHAAPAERGWIAGTVEIEPDELPGDNVRHFAVWIGAAPGVTVSPGAGPFVRSAVDVLRGAGRVADGSDIAIVSADELSRLPSLITAPADPVRLGAANRALERAGIPWRFGAIRRGEAAVTAPSSPGRSESQPRSASDSTPSFTDVSATTRYELVAQSGADADTLALVGREPWIVAGPRYVVVGSPLQPDATSFPIRAAFVPWLAQVLTARLVGEPGQVVHALPGDHIARPRWADALESANGGRTTLTDIVDVPTQAGTYFFDRAGRRVGALVVDPDERESALERLSPSDLSARIKAGRVLVAPDRGQWVAMSFRSAARRSLVEPLLVIALLLLAAEAVLVRVRGARAA